jgi:DNA-binding NtrC family response regulator
MPGLNERDNDIILLAEHFIEKFNADFKFNVTGMTNDAAELLMQQEWPGNVRELRNIIERAVLLKKSGEIDTHHLFLVPASMDSEAQNERMSGDIHLPDEGINFEELERKYIQAALSKAGGNKSRAARLLGMSRGAFRYRLEKLAEES